MSCILQDWVCELSFMQQSVLITSIRGCDGLAKYHPSKYILRWLRRCVLISAFDKCILSDPFDTRGGNFTGPIPKIKYPTLQHLFIEYLNNVDEVEHHFHMHLVHAAEILGYLHPDLDIKTPWREFYFDCCKDLHMHPETIGRMKNRLGDSKGKWLSSGRKKFI